MFFMLKTFLSLLLINHHTSHISLQTIYIECKFI